jgi:hypothetical protein
VNCVISKEKGKEDRSGASSAMHYIRFECFVFMYIYIYERDKYFCII